MKRSEIHQLSSSCDEDVMQLFQSGNEQAFTELVNRYQSRLYNFLFRYTQSREDTEDLVQETFIRMYRSRNAYERIAKFSTWIFTIGLNLMRSQYKKKSRMTTTSIDQDQDEDFSPINLHSTDSSPEDNAHANLVFLLVNNAFGNIHEDYSQLLYLRELKEMSYEEIALAVDLPMGTVKSRINRGRVKMQHMMRKLNDEALIYAA